MTRKIIGLVGSGVLAALAAAGGITTRKTHVPRPRIARDHAARIARAEEKRERKKARNRRIASQTGER